MESLVAGTPRDPTLVMVTTPLFGIEWFMQCHVSDPEGVGYWKVE